MTYQSIHGTSPSYIQSFHPCFRHDIETTTAVYTSHRLGVTPVRLSTVGKRAFPVYGATVCNDLPLHVASAPSLAVFRQRLKTFLFSRSYQNTNILLTCYHCHHYCLDTCRYLGHVKNVHDKHYSGYFDDTAINTIINACCIGF